MTDNLRSHQIENPENTSLFFFLHLKAAISFLRHIVSSISSLDEAVFRADTGIILDNIGIKEKNNALHLNEYGQIYCSPKISEDEGWSLFYPGNGIKPGEGGSYQPMETLRCNSTVSRVKTGDPLKDNEGINTNTLLLKKREMIMETEV